jgi:uncharacterized protein YndB with AHSA1/START domain
MTTNLIEREIVVEAPIEIVWKTLTEPSEISRWFAQETHFELRTGAEGVLVFGERPADERAADERTTVRLQIEAVEPPHRFAFRWAYPEHTEPREGNSLLVEFTLSAVGDATRLRMVESGFDTLDHPESEKPAYIDDHNRGWDMHLGRLGEYAAGRVQAPQR